MAKKRRKKIYSTPQKIKHTHKTTSLEMFINSINNPKCKNCEGILACHKDRTYCGKCNVSKYLQ